MKTKIYLSSIIKDKFDSVAIQFENICEKYNIELNYLEKTKDIWLRDFMPISISSNKFIKYRYEPNYLMKDKYRHLISNVEEVIPSSFNEKIKYCNIILDGGNFVRYKNKAIITDKIFSENCNLTKEEIHKKIKTCFELDELIIIPKQPWDMYGHTDSMIRWINENTVLVNDFSEESKTFNSKLLKALNSYNLNLKFVKCNKEFIKKEKWFASMNYLQLENLIIVPEHSKEETNKFILQLKNYFPNHNIEVIKCNDIIKQGGAIHCITWSI